MKRNLIIILTVLLTLVSSINIYAEDLSTYKVVINFLDINNEVIKKSEILEYKELDQVSIDLNNLKIENYEIDSIENSDGISKDNNLLIIESIKSNEEINIRYARIAKYTINHYLENDSEVILHKTTENVGIVGDLIPKEQDKDIPLGFEYAGKESTVITADGLAVVNIYYASNSFIISFDLNGGIDGPEDIYGEYGTKIENIKSPTKEGYEFIGWFKEKECINEIDTTNLIIESSVTYYAGYRLIDEDSLLTIVYYGENANDDRYSFLGKEEVNVPIGSTYTFNQNENNKYFHIHNLSCYGVTDLTPVNLSEFCLRGFKALNEDLEDGYVYLRHDPIVGTGTHYYYKYNGNFYETDKYHISYQIGETVEIKEHLYELNDEFRLFKAATSCESEYEFDYSNPLVIKENDNVLAVYLKRSVYTLSFGDNEYYPNDNYGHIEAKWGQFIYDEYKEINDSIEEENGWSLVNRRSGDTLKLLISMPKENNNYYKVRKSEGHKHINYYIKVDDNYKFIYRTNWPITATTITESDFIEIEGYEVNETESSSIGDYLDFGDKNNIRYDPKKYDLILFSYPDVTKTFKVTYGEEMSIASSYLPDPKHDYEVFDGWYLTSDFKGERVDLSSKKMPAYNLTLYAKWNKRSMNVRFIDTRTALDQTVSVEYGELIENAPVINNPNFIGWVKSDYSNLIVNLNNYKVTTDIELYAKYKNDIFIDYVVNYQTKGGDTVSNPTVGSIIKGNKIYINPKPSNLLDIAYRGEYKPEKDKYIFEVDEENNNFIITYIPVTKYSLTLVPINLKDNESIVLSINGKGFDNLEVPINKETTITGFYENESYYINFDNKYSYTYDDLDSFYYLATEDKEIPITLTKHSNNFIDAENHLLNIFN